METGTTKKPKPVLEYEGSFKLHRGPPVKAWGARFELVPEHALVAAVAFFFLSLVIPEDIGSGHTIINPFRVLSVILLNGALMAYCWIRIDDDQTLKPWLRALYAGSLLPIVLLIWTTYYILNGQRRFDVVSPHNPFLQIVLSVFALAVLISVGKLAWRRLRRRRHRV